MKPPSAAVFFCFLKNHIIHHLISKAIDDRSLHTILYHARKICYHEGSILDSLGFPSKPKRKPPAETLELRAKVKELSKSGKTPLEIAKILGKSRPTIYEHITSLLEDGQLKDNETTYTKGTAAAYKNNWYNIIKKTEEELAFYEKQGLVPTIRKMYYRLIELGVLKKSKSNYEKLCARTADARRGVDSAYTKETNLPRLPIDCFRDDNRDTIGHTDMTGPEEPTADEPPDDPIEVTKNAILDCKDIILNYDGLCKEGQSGQEPGRWYQQPIYCHILCESATIKPDLRKFQDADGTERCVKVSATGGYISTPFMHEFCKDLKETAEKYEWIEQIVVLYFGDSDDHGQEIRRCVENALEWYTGNRPDLPEPDFTIPVPVEVRLVAITPEQVEEFNLTGYQLEAFFTTDDRLEDFKQIVMDSIDDCWDQDIYDDNCPPEEYDYESNGEEEPEDIDVDNTFYEDENGNTVNDMTIREKMASMATEAFKEGWEKDYLNSTSTSDTGGG